MAYWAVVVSAERYAEERLYARESLRLGDDGTREHLVGDSGETGGDRPRSGEPIVLVAETETPVLFGLGRLGGSFCYGAAPSDVSVTYTHRLFDEPLPLEGISMAPGLHRLTAAEFDRIAGRVGADKRIDADKSEWLVSVALPIEAPSAAEAVREFWTYVDKLGPRELPAFVSPVRDELAMQAYVLGDETNLDPEEDDD